MPCSREPILQVSAKLRDGPAQAFSEFVATFGLLATILGSLRNSEGRAPRMAVGLYITSAYWFTASTSFANPAVTIARMSVEQLRRHCAMVSASFHPSPIGRRTGRHPALRLAA